MTDHPSRWFQLSLKSLFGLTLLVATFLAGYTLATKRAGTIQFRGFSDSSLRACSRSAAALSRWLSAS